MSQKTDPPPTTTSRKDRRAAERASRKGSSTASVTTAPRSSGPSMFTISVIAVIVGLIAVGALVIASGGFGDDDGLPPVTAAVDPPPAAALRDGRSLGDPAAPVLVEAFEDPQCPACGAFNERITPLLFAAGGPVSSGDVRFTYRDFAFLGPESIEAAAAMRVADDLGDKFWEMHDTVFFNQNSENQGAFSRDRLADMAEIVGLDRAAFLAAMEDPQYADAVEDETELGRTLGVNSTPSLFVNGQIIRGVPSWDDLQAAIAAAIAAAAASPSPAPASAPPATEAPASAAPASEAPATPAPASGAPATVVPSMAPASVPPATEAPASPPA